MNNSGIEIFKSEDGKTQVQVVLENETVWLNLNQMVSLFERDKSVVSRHISNIFKEEEFTQKATVAKFATVQTEGEREIERDIEYFNLDVIISVGYRVKSKRGTQFRIWANKILKDYLIKGYSLNEKKLIQQNEQLIRKINQNYNCINQTPCKPTNNWNSLLTLFNIPDKIYF